MDIHNNYNEKVLFSVMKRLYMCVHACELLWMCGGISWIGVELVGACMHE